MARVGGERPPSSVIERHSAASRSARQGRSHAFPCSASATDYPLRPPPPGTTTCDQLYDNFMQYVEGLGIELYPAQEEAIMEVRAPARACFAVAE